MRIMDDYVKGRNDAMSYARWETKLHTKDRTADRKRMENQLIEDVLYASNLTKQKRKQKIEELYAADDARYEEELLAMNLTFRREKI